MAGFSVKGAWLVGRELRDRRCHQSALFSLASDQKIPIVIHMIRLSLGACIFPTFSSDFFLEPATIAGNGKDL
jgi:hypothetical protein